MKVFSYIGSSVSQLLSFIFVLAFLLGILNIHFSDKNEYCEMTYMFEYPQFVRVTVPENILFPQYGLYAYSEGRFTEKARKMWFDGVPVLFLPGNSGSHMQARSLASVALRKALTGPYEYHFDYFTIGYNEELSGLYGGVLQSQTQFASACIARILSLYKSNKYTKTVPTQVILIGHSMGGVISKRLLAYPSTMNMTSIAITLAAPLEAPVVNFDATINDYYKLMNSEWEQLANNTAEYENKLLLSFGNGPKDILMPSSLTSSKDSYINALTTAIPGVWVSANHVGIVWCKQLVMAINKYLFDIVDPISEQVSENRQHLTAKARQYFQANRSITLSPDIVRPNVTMVADAFWYEDNRRIYQVARPEIQKTTYLMIRLVNFPQNRFVAVETVNVSDKDWVFGCNAMFTHHTHRYCKQATSLTELSRWTGADVDFGKRKLATIHLHDVMQKHPDWSHVVVKVSPTRKPIQLNVDINDHASRRITVRLPSIFSYGSTVLIQETEANSLYYELILPGFNSVHDAYLLYVEPTASCNVRQYHVSAEVHVPWAKNNEYYHYFTHLKQSPMKLRLFNSNPKATYGLDVTDHVRITLLLDPQCTFNVRISSSWYHSLAQIARNYTPILTPYVAAIVLLAARSNIISLKRQGTCMSFHGALMSGGVSPLHVLVCARLAFMFIISVPFLSYVFENTSWRNHELQHFMRTLLIVPTYMTALGILHISAAAVLVVMVFSSQLAHRLLFRIMWRGGSNIAEKVASGLQKVPFLVSIAIITGVPLSCGAASLVAGGAFYAFMLVPSLVCGVLTILGSLTCGAVPLACCTLSYVFTLSKMYEEYLEDYVYKLMAKVASKVCKLFKTKKKHTESETSLVPKDSETKSEIKSIESKKEVEGSTTDIVADSKEKRNDNTKALTTDENEKTDSRGKENAEKCESKSKRRDSGDIDEDLNNLNFHMMLFFMWMCVTLVNVPALLTWAKNFKYSMVLKPDTSYTTGLAMSACSACLWQTSGPKKNLRYYDAVATLLYVVAISILVLGPFSLTVVNYGVTFMYVVITLQQLCDKEDTQKNISEFSDNKDSSNNSDVSEQTEASKEDNKPSEDAIGSEDKNKSEPEPSSSEKPEMDRQNSEDCVCSENRIYSVFKNLREKFNFTED